MADREKPSWRERDRKKDKSAHRPDAPAAPGNAPRVVTATANYRRQLDALFDRGVVPDALKDKLPAATSENDAEGAEAQTAEGKAQVKRLRAVRTAAGGPELIRAIDALRTNGGLPDDLEILLRVLEHPDDAVLLEAVVLIEKHVDLGNPLPNKKVFIQRLAGLEASSFDPRVQRRAAALAFRLK